MQTRPLRADAQRNRDRLLAVAVRAFSQDGPDVPLDAIAREAGVGIGTLYRRCRRTGRCEPGWTGSSTT